MKKKYKYLIITGLSAVLCFFLTLPTYAQRGGGGHGGGGGGGRGFSGGHSGGGFSGGRSMGSSHFSGSQRAGFAQRGGFARGQRSGYNGNVRGAGVNRNGGYARGYGHGTYGHGGYGHGGRGSGYGWGRHGGYFYSNGYYGSLYYPYLGLDFGYLPYGDYPFYWGDEEYYFGNGLYYQSAADDQYTVVEPPVGATVNSLSSDAQSILIDGQQYYELNGVYYSPITKADGSIVYQITGKDGELNTNVDGVTTVVPKEGDIVTRLPPDCRKVKLNGNAFFVSEDGIYYQQTTDGNNNKAYKIVGLETGQSGN